MAKEKFYCRYEGHYIQRHLEKSRVGRESRLSITSRLNWAMRLDRKEESEKKIVQTKETRREGQGWEQDSTWPKYQSFIEIRSWGKGSL